jgi:hypothetical protein
MENLPCPSEALLAVGTIIVGPRPTVQDDQLPATARDGGACL